MMFNFFRRLQWKLTLSYAIVTAGTVIVLAGMLVGIALLLESANSNRTYDSMFWSKTAFQDNIPYLLDQPDTLQSWLERVQTKGFEARDFQSHMGSDSLTYANTIIKGTPIYVLNPDLKILATVPQDQ